MKRNSINQDNSDDANIIKKTTYWEIYGVKRFPYHGKRKFTPLLYQSLNGRMVISNDVFGLTISQFERKYKACLDRRKTNEQWILNLRYPDKSSKEYLEYLEKCTDCNTDHLLRLGNYPRQKYLFEHLVNTVGSEIDIRKRQRLFIITDMIHNASVDDLIKISSGSLSEGLDLPGSDMDIMYIINKFHVFQNELNIKHPMHGDAFVLETDINHPGFTRIRIVVQTDRKSSFIFICFNCPPGKCTGKNTYLNRTLFNNICRRQITNSPIFAHGPCFADKDQTIDIAFCLRSKLLPQNAIAWTCRHRRQWPPTFIIDRIRNYGCLLVPIGPKTVSDDKLWRVSFSVAEKILVYSFNFTQLLCYALLKLTLKRIVNTHNDVKDLLCSYFLKTALFWVSEESDIETFRVFSLYSCFSLCLDKLISWVKILNCPNYFIPEHNMFLGKIDKSNQTILVCVLESIKLGGIEGLISSLFSPANENPSLFSINSEFLSVNLDFLFYKINTKYRERTTDILKLYEQLAFIESLLKSESSPFIIGVCKHQFAEISKFVAQKMPLPNTIVNTYNMRKRYHQHLQNGTMTDAVSGWLLYASFYYVTGQFNITLRLTELVLSRCSPDMVLNCNEHSCGHRVMYRQNVHSSMTLNQRMKMAIIGNVRYCEHSSLIPEELKLEVETTMVEIPPVVLSHCLRFLCYHHLGDIINRQKSLRDLHLTVKQQYLIQFAFFPVSITIVGVCFEILGAKDVAYQCYEEAIQVNDWSASTAKIRKSKLEGSFCGL
ncbi:uncharacterized protein LOC134700917 [Mytilus trossulus]|uniref:uncharacterized protein LOC134700917 n=1 Tax=Mytilus trossulus TaxID=6551 RepID=UPI00300617AD